MFLNLLYFEIPNTLNAEPQYINNQTFSFAKTWMHNAYTLVTE